MLRPVFCRTRQAAPASCHLLAVARFLESRDLLTDGGRLSLAAGLRGRGDVLSLSLQDVRASAHGLARDLCAERDSGRWEALAEEYYGRYDRGKPRRPTRLQRLMIAWSADLGPLGMLEACARHSRLWEELERALAFEAAPDADARLLAVALNVHRQKTWTPWLHQLEAAQLAASDLLEMLPLLPYPEEEVRLDWLSRGHDLPAASRILACRRSRLEGRIEMSPALRELTRRQVAQTYGSVDARWLGVLRGYRWPTPEVEQLRLALSPSDPVHRIVYGPRPGRPWLTELLEGLSAPG